MLNKIARTLGLAALVAFAGSAAQAGVMTFSSFTGTAPYTEAGLTMTGSTVWVWPTAGVAHMDEGVAVFKLVSGDYFNLDSVDMILDGGVGPARFSAYDGSTLLGSVTVNGNAGHYNFSAMFDEITEFRISVLDNHFSFDNLTISDSAFVPEPASLALVGVALVGIGAARRRKA